MANAPKTDPPAPKWSAKKTYKNVVTVDVPARRDAEWEQWFMLSGDRHWDSPHSDHKLMKQHLDEAKNRQAGIIDIGDLFCVMQGHGDPRGERGSIRPEHSGPNYLGSVVSTAVDFFEPWASQFILIGTGNHEKKVLKKYDNDLLEQLTSRLNERTGSEIIKCGYGGWVRFMFKDVSSEGKRLFSQTIKLRYEHGYAGGGKATKGVTQAPYRSLQYPDAQICVSGHIHESWNVEFCRDRLNDMGRQYQDTQVHVVTPTYQNSFGDGSDGWHVETGKGPKPLGCTWLRFYWKRRINAVVFDVIRAQ